MGVGPDVVTLLSCGGSIGTLTLTSYILVDVEGVPVNQLIAPFAPFGSGGQHQLSGTVPASAQGFDMTFQAIAVDLVDGTILSNTDVLSVQ